MKIAGAAILPQSFLVLGGAAVIVVVVSLFLERTLRESDDRDRGQSVRRGLSASTPRMVEISFAVSATIGAVAGYS